MQWPQGRGVLCPAGPGLFMAPPPGGRTPSRPDETQEPQQPGSAHFFSLLSFFFFNFFLWESQEHGVKGGALSQVKSRKGQQGHFSRGSGLEGLRQTQRRKRKGCHDHGHGSPLREERFSSRPQEGLDTDPVASVCPTAAAGSDRAPQVVLHPTHQAGVPRKGTWTGRGPAKPVREERVEPASVCRAAPLEIKWLLLPTHRWVIPCRGSCLARWQMGDSLTPTQGVCGAT